MIGKTSIGSNISNALAYGAGELDPRIKLQKMAQVELLATYNLGNVSPQGMALEMEAVVDGSRCKSPVWHTSLSLKPDEQLTADEWRQAAHQYCQGIGADPDRHQIAVYQHHDTAHQHIHIYINRVPMDGKAALPTSHNYAVSMKTIRQVEEQFGLSRPVRLPVAEAQILPKHPKQAATPDAQHIRETIKETLAQDKPTSIGAFGQAMATRGVTAVIEPKKSGQWGTQFQYTAPGSKRKTKISGGDVGYKYSQLVTHLEANKAPQVVETNKRVNPITAQTNAPEDAKSPSIRAEPAPTPATPEKKKTPMASEVKPAVEDATKTKKIDKLIRDAGKKYYLVLNPNEAEAIINGKSIEFPMRNRSVSLVNGVLRVKPIDEEAAKKAAQKITDLLRVVHDNDLRQPKPQPVPANTDQLLSVTAVPERTNPSLVSQPPQPQGVDLKLQIEAVARQSGNDNEFFNNVKSVGIAHSKNGYLQFGPLERTLSEMGITNIRSLFKPFVAAPPSAEQMAQKRQDEEVSRIQATYLAIDIRLETDHVRRMQQGEKLSIDGTERYLWIENGQCHITPVSPTVTQAAHEPKPAINQTNAAGAAKSAPDKPQQSLKEQFVAMLGYPPCENDRKRLEAGVALSYPEYSKTLWVNDGELKFRHYTPAQTVTVANNGVEPADEPKPATTQTNAPQAAKQAQDDAKPAVTTPKATGSSKPTLKEQFVKQYGVNLSDAGWKELEDGLPVNSGKLGLTIQFRNGEFKSRPYTPKQTPTDPQNATTAVTQEKPAPNQTNTPGAAKPSVGADKPMLPPDELVRLARSCQNGTDFTEKLRRAGVERTKDAQEIMRYGPQKRLWSEIAPGQPEPPDLYGKEKKKTRKMSP